MTGAVTVVKVGGGLLRHEGALATVGARVARLAGERPVVVVPGGGPFADTVRELDRQLGLDPSAAHWMAILAMDQFAWVVAGAIRGARLVEDRPGMLEAHRDGAVPVLAPSRWLRAADELPHAWEVTSDSLAAYLATLLGAEELVLVKPVAGGRELADPWFDRVVPPDLRVRIVSAAAFAAEDAGG